MATHHTGNALGRPTITALRLGFGAVAVLALSLGYLGFGAFARHSTAPATYGDRPIDLVYYDLQLFVLGADPLQNPGPYPLALEIARFAAPVVTVYAMCEIVLRLFAAEIRRVRVRLTRGHVIVCGEGAIAETLTRRLRAAGRYVVSVRSSAEPLPRAVRGRITVLGDARDPEVLLAAGIRRAMALYACGADDSATNAAIAFSAASVRPEVGGALSVYVHIRDPDLCLTLQARYLGLDQPVGLRLDFFNIDDVAARMLFANDPLQVVNGRPPQVTVAGATAFGRAVIVEAARRWTADNPAAVDPIPVAVIDQKATSTVADLADRYPFLRTVCHLQPHDADLIHMLVNGRLRAPPDRAFICYDDEEHALKTATVADRFWRSEPESVIVRLDRLAAFQDGVATAANGRLFNEVDGRVRVFGVVSTACRPDLIGDDLVGRIARVIHERYRQARRRDGDLLRGNPSMVPWEELPEHLRESNRRQARDIGRKLGEIRCVLIPRVGRDHDGVLSDEEIDQLARMEHGRWHDDRRAAGWRHAASADPTGPNDKIHPGLCAWPELPDRLRRRNYEAVRNLTAILSDAGFQIVRQD